MHAKDHILYILHLTGNVNDILIKFCTYTVTEAAKPEKCLSKTSKCDLLT